MKKEKRMFHHTDGTVEGVYIKAGQSTPLVIFINGHNGFYNYGMFPYIQQKFFENHISSYSFNFSHGGVSGDADYFEDLQKYERNCMRLETEDLLCVLRQSITGLNGHPKVFLFAHSLGGVPAVFGAKKAIAENIKIDGIILAATVKTLHFWPAELLTEWATAGVYYMKNNRTKQNLPQGFEFLQEILKSETTWNVRKVISDLEVPVLLIHGENDEAVPPGHSLSLFEWVKNNPDAWLEIIPGATHTFNTKHPFENTSVELEKMLGITIPWILKH